MGFELLELAHLVIIYSFLYGITISIDVAILALTLICLGSLVFIVSAVIAYRKMSRSVLFEEYEYHGVAFRFDGNKSLLKNTY